MISQLHQHSKEQDAQWSIRHLCGLFEINRGWYYERQKVVAQKQKVEAELKGEIEKIVLEFPGYGYRRVGAALQKSGLNIGWGRVLKLLRKWGLLCRPVRKKKVITTQSDPKAPHAANLLLKAKKAGEISEPNRAWVGDVMYVVTRKEQGYLASLLDGCSRRVVGWALSRANDTALTLKALNQAIATRRPPPGLIHHTDQGSNYTSAPYQARLAQIGAKVSHSRPGCPQENGMAESFNKTVSYEKLFLEEYETLAEVEKSLESWLEPLYNERRLHSSLGYQSPVEFEQNWLKQLTEGGPVDS
jgi:putative transposase